MHKPLGFQMIDKMGCDIGDRPIFDPDIVRFNLCSYKGRNGYRRYRILVVASLA